MRAIKRVIAVAGLSLALAVPLGATAVGTGIGSPPGYREHVVRLLAEGPEKGLQRCVARLEQIAGEV